MFYATPIKYWFNKQSIVKFYFILLYVCKTSINMVLYSSANAINPLTLLMLEVTMLYNILTGKSRGQALLLSSVVASEILLQLHGAIENDFLHCLFLISTLLNYFRATVTGIKSLTRLLSDFY